MFSRLKVALAGHDFFTPEQLMQRVIEGMSGWDISYSHLTQVWDWKDIKELDITPFVGLRLAHAVRFFRKPSGIWVKWKQYVTCESWSQPVLIVEADRVKFIADWRPAQVPQYLGYRSDMLMKWLEIGSGTH